MTIYTTLKQEHTSVKALLSNLEKDPLNKEILAEFEHELSGHNDAEEKAFYAALKEKVGPLSVVTTLSAAEHKAVAKLIKLLNKTKKEVVKTLLIKLIKRALNWHIEKEENEVFDMAKDCFTPDEEKKILDDFKKARGKS